MAESMAGRGEMDHRLPRCAPSFSVEHLNGEKDPEQLLDEMAINQENIDRWYEAIAVHESALEQRCLKE